MKKIIGSLIVIFVAIATSANLFAQTLPAVTKTITWSYLKACSKADTSATLDSLKATTAINFAVAGAYASGVDLDSGSVVNEVWDVTNVVSRGGITETQQLYFYTDADGKDLVALVRKGATTVMKNGKIRIHRGDESNSPWK